MKTVLLCMLAAAAIVGFATSSVVIPTTRANFALGSISYGDKLLHRQVMYRPAVTNSIQTEDYVYRGNATTWISSVQATEVGYSQYGSVFLLNGGVGHNNVSLRIQSYTGYGYYYIIDIWGRA